MKILFLFLTLALMYSHALQLQNKTSLIYQPSTLDVFDYGRMRIA